MSVDEIMELIDSVAEYITYIYPGYITIYVYFFLKGKTAQDGKGIILKSVVLSFVYQLVLDEGTYISSVAYHFAIICFSVFIAYGAYWLQTREETYNFLEFFGVYTRFEEQAIEMLDSGKTSAWVRVYLRNEKIVYEGFLGSRELESEKMKFITLKKYKKYVINEVEKKEDLCVAEYDTDEDEVLIFVEDVARIEKRNISRKREIGFK